MVASWAAPAVEKNPSRERGRALLVDAGAGGGAGRGEGQTKGKKDPSGG